MDVWGFREYQRTNFSSFVNWYLAEPQWDWDKDKRSGDPYHKGENRGLRWGDFGAVGGHDDAAVAVNADQSQSP